MTECDHCGKKNQVNCECEICGGCEDCCPYPDEVNPPPHHTHVPEDWGKRPEDIKKQNHEQIISDCCKAEELFGLDELERFANVFNKRNF